MDQLLYHIFISQKKKTKVHHKKLNIRQKISAVKSLKYLGFKKGRQKRNILIVISPRGPIENMKFFWLICVEVKGKVINVKKDIGKFKNVIPIISEMSTSFEEQ